MGLHVVAAGRHEHAHGVGIADRLRRGRLRQAHGKRREPEMTQDLPHLSPPQEAGARTRSRRPGCPPSRYASPWPRASIVNDYSEAEATGRILPAEGTEIFATGNEGRQGARR